VNTDYLSQLVITKVHSVSIMYNEKNARIKRANRPRWAIVLKYEGETQYLNCGQTYRSDLRHMVVLPKGCSYEWQCTHSGHYAIIEFESELSCPEILWFPVKNGEKILRMFQELEYKRTLKRPMAEPESIRDTYSILLKLAQSEPQKYLPSAKQRKITPALDYIAKHYNTRIKNDELAALTGLSTVYFRKLFTEVTGTSPIDYIQSLRIKKAKEMLRSDYSSITDIAQALGYGNIYDFSRAFKKCTGLSPLQYKAQDV